MKIEILIKAARLGGYLDRCAALAGWTGRTDRWPKALLEDISVEVKEVAEGVPISTAQEIFSIRVD